MKRRQFVLGAVQSALALSTLQLVGCGSQDGMSLGGSPGAQGGAGGVTPKVSDTVSYVGIGNDGVVSLESNPATGGVKLKAGDAGYQVVDSGPVAGGLLASPSSAAQDSFGNFYVADSSKGFVQVYNASGNPIGKIGSPGQGAGQFAFPSGVAVDSAGGRLFVSDTFLNRILVFNLAGNTLVATFGSFGTEPGLLNGPKGLALDKQGNLHVVDAGNQRVNVYTSSGGFVRSYGRYGRELGQFLAPNWIGILPDGRILVSDPVSTFVTIFDTQGVAQDRFQPTLPGGKKGYPTSLAVSSDGTVYVSAGAAFQG